MTPNEYQQGCLRTESVISNLDAVRNNGDQVEVSSRLLHGLVGIATEAGELLDLLKKQTFYGKGFDKTKIIDECGDVLWYVSIALSAVGCTLEECMEKNNSKLRIRFPDKFDSEKAINRDLAAEKKVFQQAELI